MPPTIPNTLSVTSIAELTSAISKLSPQEAKDILNEISRLRSTSCFTNLKIIHPPCENIQVSQRPESYDLDPENELYQYDAISVLITSLFSQAGASEFVISNITRYFNDNKPQAREVCCLQVVCCSAKANYIKHLIINGLATIPTENKKFASSNSGYGVKLQLTKQMELAVSKLDEPGNTKTLVQILEEICQEENATKSCQIEPIGTTGNTATEEANKSNLVS